MKTRETLPNLYEFTDFRAYLNSYFAAKKKSGRGFSTRRWCQDLGLKSSSTLNMILRGRRNPGPNIVDRLVQYFEFSAHQRDYFETLVKLEKSKDDSERKVRHFERLRSIHPRKDVHLIDFNLFSSISNWYCFAVREMVNSKDFREDPEWISKKLRGKVSAKKIQDAIRVMLASGFLERDSRGFLIQKDSQIGTLADISNEALKRFHEQMIGLALESVRSAPIETRDISGSTFNIDPADLPALKAELRKVRQEIYRCFEKPQASTTYQLNFQLFPLTEISDPQAPQGLKKEGEV